MLRFQLFGIPFQIGPYFWVGSALLGSNVANGTNATILLLVWVACVLVSIVTHELGHALTARRYGVQPSIELHAIGGLTRMPGHMLTRAQDFWVTLAGPAAGFALYLLTAVVRAVLTRAEAPILGGGTAGLMVVSALLFLWQINLAWTLFNLLPILPLDGGRLVNALLGPQRLGITQTVGVFCAGVAATLAWLLFGQWPAAIFLGYLAFVNLRGNPRAVPGGVSR